MLFYTYLFFSTFHLFIFFSVTKTSVGKGFYFSVIFTKTVKSIRLMFEYQTTGTLLIYSSGLRFCLLMPKKRGGGEREPRPVSHSSVGGGLLFRDIFLTRRRVCFLRVQSAIASYSATGDAVHPLPRLVIGLDLRLWGGVF